MTSTADTAPRRRLTELDGLRGLAALAVVGDHWLLLVPGNPGAPVPGGIGAGLNWLYSTPLEAFVAGQQMVLLFFVLSGLVLALPRFSGRGVAYPRYLLTRAFRLYPAAWAAVAFSAACLLLLPMGTRPGLPSWLNSELGGSLTSAGVLHYVGLIAPFDPSHLDLPLWSLEQELRVSLLIPVLVLIVRRWHPGLVFGLAGALVAAGALGAPVASGDWLWTLVVTGCFLLGVLIARRRQALSTAWERLPSLGRVLLLLAIPVSFWIPMRAGLTAVPVFVLTVISVLGAATLIVAAQSGRLRRFLNTTIVSWLGRISYSLYLVHLILLRVLAATDPFGLPLIALAPIGIAASLGLATAMQRYIESPALRLGRALAGRERVLDRAEPEGRVAVPAVWELAA